MHYRTKFTATLVLATGVMGACSDGTPTAPALFPASLAAGGKPGGGKIAYTNTTAYPQQSIWVANADGKGASQITGGHEDAYPAWSRDYKKLAFVRYETATGQSHLLVITPAGSKLDTLATFSGYVKNLSWSPDGSHIAFDRSVLGNLDIWVRSVDGTVGFTQRLTTDAGLDSEPTWSPDGQRIAFWSNRTGNEEIFVMNADGSNQHRISACYSITVGGCTRPAWSPIAGDERILVRWENGPEVNFALMNSDGSGFQVLPLGGDFVKFDIAWSRDGSRIALVGIPPGGIATLYTAALDGSGLAPLTPSLTQIQVHPAWAR